ncbi:OmpW family outer membrane protein [Actimicrobium sp. CCC2.4]|uniref:OmpW/AlkL family protein n=1 Tax=Actimicrobium sp. CCC2.4 TaxID=3048606 RepID=UPI002AC9BBDE|nr:OmpW family outer membrane protein [Actimicrobium sp. CCC2.4]MEB0137339.1 OmpW family outer membrane protein [Actimicrobium sp. CCC2.4]WPX33400.1 OmpW family outer membrane protein [Actimicrobium sp. CCC2.4]
MNTSAAVVLAVSALGLFSTQAMAQQQSPWQVRSRVINLAPADNSDPVGGAGASDRLSVSKKTIPEVDISYFFTPNLAAELVLTYPQKHTVYLDGNNVGTFKHLPPTLLLQYHFMPDRQFSPYVGAGVNYTRISSVNLLGGAGSLENSSVGFALQAGVDYKLDKNWSLNLDIKKVQIRSDLMISGVKASALQVDPLMVGVGLGYRF